MSVPASAGPASWIDAEIAIAWRRVGACLARLVAAGERPPNPAIERRVAEHAGSDEGDELFARSCAPLGRLAHVLGLRALDVEVIATALAPHLDPALEDAFALLSRNQRRVVDLELVADLLGLDRSARLELVDVLDPERALIALRLLAVELGDARAPFARQIQIPLDVLPLLAGRGELSPALRRSARLVRAAADLDDLVYDDVTRARLAETCATIGASADLAEPPWIVLWGPRGAGKRTLAARIAAYATRPLLEFDTTTVADGSGDEQLRRAQREALLHGAILYVGPVEGELLANEGRDLVRRLRNFAGTVIFGVTADQAPRFAASRPLQELAVPPLGERERLALWQRQIPNVAADAIARGFKLTPGSIVEIAAEARASTRGVKPADLRAGVDRRLRSELGELARPVTTSVTWNDLVLPADQRSRLEEVIDRHRLADQVFGAWGLGARLGYGKGVIALFSGPPGTGKTMIAGLVANELELALYKVDLSQVVSKWVGETEKQLGKLFDLAARAHAVLLFDEADALLGARTKVESSNDRYGNLAVNYLLQRLEDYEGVAILTTNLASSLDPAVQRRLTLHLRLALPNEDERARLWRSFLSPAIPGATTIDFRALGDELELAGGHIKNAAVRAAFLAASAGRPLDMELVRRAARLELEDMGRL
ncbi:MAG TPA: ATP-binding protein [Kofleriaceae bacterium]|nr:ATP-binding protein [Kofleriaceae bacterium]